MQRPQPWCIGRGNINGDVSRVLVHLFKANQIIRNRILDRRIEVFANINAQYPLVFGRFNALNQIINSLIVEAHAINDRLSFRDTEHSRLGIAWLRAWRDGADFNESESQTGQSINVVTVLVQTGCQSNRIWKLNARNRYRQIRHRRHQTRQQMQPFDHSQHVQAKFVCRLGIHGKQERTNGVVPIHINPRWE